LALRREDALPDGGFAHLAPEICLNEGNTRKPRILLLLTAEIPRVFALCFVKTPCGLSLGVRGVGEWVEYNGSHLIAHR
jgi:hypothetical protein